ncbi:hypothetical protein BS47DRAFT_1367426 [Hydnum rufescens UP504]|uniref:Uncharacterized protein n=1 Tax=Hydnum rufescens UP504 TaxID=1448309 RepID=A0A9P6AI98_9AGAM|nr:hypothetical protein BS47DRAFT_1367426 [Hydnum rufescens UP504]
MTPTNPPNHDNSPHPTSELRSETRPDHTPTVVGVWSSKISLPLNDGRYMAAGQNEYHTPAKAGVWYHRIESEAPKTMTRTTKPCPPKWPPMSQANACPSPQGSNAWYHTPPSAGMAPHTHPSVVLSTFFFGFLWMVPHTCPGGQYHTPALAGVWCY